MISATFFPSLRDSKGKRFSTSWHLLLERLVAPRVYAVKEDCPGFSLATYAGDRRSKANVELVYAVGLDFDKELDLDELRRLFSESACFIHTTWQSTLDVPRARVFLRLTRPVTGPEYERVYAACAWKATGGGLVVDRNASDPSRFWFLPAVRAIGCPMIHWTVEGKPVDVEAALAAFPPPEPPSAPPPPSSGTRVGNVEERAAAYIAKCDPAISGQGGHNQTFLVAQKLVLGFGLDEATAYRLMVGWNRQCQPPWSEWELRRKIRQAAERGKLPPGSLRDAERRR